MQHKYFVDSVRMEARQIVKMPYGLPGHESFIKERYPGVLNLVERYKRDHDEKRIVRVCQEHKHAYVTHSRTRFEDYYRNRTRDKLLHIVGYPDLERYGCAFISFTLEPSRFTSLYAAYRASSEKMHRMIGTMYKKFKSLRGHFYAKETQQNGMIHYHAMFIGLQYLNDDAKAFIIRAWADMAPGQGIDFGGYAKPTNYNGFRDITDYVVKNMVGYLYKQYEIEEQGDSDKGYEFNRDVVLGWACGWRSYAMSTNVSKWLKEIGELGLSKRATNKCKFFYVGTYHWFEFEQEGTFFYEKGSKYEEAIFNRGG